MACMDAVCNMPIAWTHNVSVGTHSPLDLDGSSATQAEYPQQLDCKPPMQCGYGPFWAFAADQGQPAAVASLLGPQCLFTDGKEGYGRIDHGSPAPYGSFAAGDYLTASLLCPADYSGSGLLVGNGVSEVSAFDTFSPCAPAALPPGTLYAGVDQWDLTRPGMVPGTNARLYQEGAPSSGDLAGTATQCITQVPPTGEWPCIEPFAQQACPQSYGSGQDPIGPLATQFQSADSLSHTSVVACKMNPYRRRVRFIIPKLPRVLASRKRDGGTNDMISMECANETPIDAEESLISGLPMPLWQSPARRQRTSLLRETLEKEVRVLAKLRAEGLSYAQCQKRAGFKHKLSTLRGRMRTYKNPATARIRKPPWSRQDVSIRLRDCRRRAELTRPIKTEILERTVQRMIRHTVSETKRGSTKKRHPKYESTKIPWVMVSEEIRRQGISYGYGPGSCSKKWFEMKGHHRLW